MAMELGETNEPQSDMEIKTRKLGYGVKQMMRNADVKRQRF